jgi:hypothetical protein
LKKKKRRSVRGGVLRLLALFRSALLTVLLELFPERPPVVGVHFEEYFVVPLAMAKDVSLEATNDLVPALLAVRLAAAVKGDDP